MKRILVVALVLAVGCKKEPAQTNRKLDLPTARAAALGDFADNPLLAYVPDDTPYAFATFKPIPVDYIEKMGSMFKPMFAQMQQIGGEGADRMRAVAEEIGTFSVPRFEELGFSAKARMVIYGIGVHPVFRAEIGDGDKILALIGRIATRWGAELPTPTQEGAYKVWRKDEGDMGFLIALGKTEIVGAFGPPAVLDQNRGLILGTTKPSKSLSTARFKDIAQRDGFNAQGVGFLEFERLFSVLLTSSGQQPPAACATALHALAQRAPRLTAGYDDFSSKRISFGFVLQLAPDLVAEAKKVSTSLPGIDRMLADKAMFAVAGAFDLAQVRKLGSRAAVAMRELGAACNLNEMADAADELESAVQKPLPPFLEGLTGGIAVLRSMDMGPRGPEQLAGWGAIRLADTAPLLAMAAQEVPNFKLEANGKPQPLPPGTPFAGHVAASKTALGVGLGPDSQRLASDALGGTPQPAPLGLMRIDYERFFSVMGKLDPSSQMMSDAYKMFGVATVQANVDDRGAVMWMTMQMN